MMTITVVMVIGGVVIIMMMGVRMRGMDTEDNVQTFFGMHVMKMDEGRDLKKTKNLKKSNKDESCTLFYELIHG
jgi:hypothetical protein